MLVARFLIDLQTAHRHASNGGLSTGSASLVDSESGLGGSIFFDRVVGSIASSIPADLSLQVGYGCEDEEEQAPCVRASDSGL